MSAALRQSLKRWFFRLLGKDAEAVVVSFLSGEAELARAMQEEIGRLVPDRRHFSVELEPGSAWSIYRRLRRRFRRYRIGLAPVLFDSDPQYRVLRKAAFLLAPTKILAYNARLERHHLKLSAIIASWLFLRGVPLDRIFLRPWWLCPWKKDRSVIPDRISVLDGRPLIAGRTRVAILSPYAPYPLSHGGAVRIYYLLREIAKEFDIFLFAFTESTERLETAPLLEHCARLTLVPLPRYREPRWSSWNPPQVEEYRSPAMKRALHDAIRDCSIELLQVEYTHLASYGGDVLVEHDVTFDLFAQVHRRERNVSSWWNLFRWRRYERAVIENYRAVAVMSEKDRELLGSSKGVVIPNGVDLARFRMTPEPAGSHLAFVGSFRHRPNAIAWRFFMTEVWPLVAQRIPEAHVTVVAGPEPHLYWPADWEPLQAPERVRLLGFVRNVEQIYAEANIVIVPTLVSAGTNLKVLEALACVRALISTTSGCAGLGLEHGSNAWIADTASDFADGIVRLLKDELLRARLAAAGRLHVERDFGWTRIGRMERDMLRNLLAPSIVIRRARREDLDAVAEIQRVSLPSASWRVEDYLNYDFTVAVGPNGVAGFVVARETAPDEVEILNLAIAPAYRRQRIGIRLMNHLLAAGTSSFFLEVRESNTGARALYEKLGFRDAGRRPNYYHDPQETAIVMRRQIAST